MQLRDEPDWPSGSCSLASRQPQARPQQLALLWVPKIEKVKHDNRCDDPQPFDDVPRILEPSHMRVARREKSIRGRETGKLFDQGLQCYSCVLKSSVEEMGEANPDDRIGPAITGSERPVEQVQRLS